MPGVFEESKHPRGGKGSSKGGQFVSKGEGPGGGPKPFHVKAELPEESMELFGKPITHKEGGAKDTAEEYASSWMLSGGIKALQAVFNESKEPASWKPGELGLGMEHAEAIKHYQDASYELNDGLRTGEFQKGLSDVAFYEKQIKLLDEAFSKVPPLAKATTVLRGMAIGRDANAKRFFERLVPGELVYDEAFVSTTVDESVAKTFARTDGVIMEINVPAGARVLVPSYFSAYGLNNEEEVVLPRAELGTAFRVKSKKLDNFGRIRLLVDMVMLDTSYEQKKKGSESVRSAAA